MVRRNKTAGKSVTMFIWITVAGKSGADKEKCRNICDKVNLGLNSRKICDKVNLDLSGRKI